jgi:hypothetical protein
MAGARHTLSNLSTPLSIRANTRLSVCQDVTQLLQQRSLGDAVVRTQRGSYVGIIVPL